MRTAGRSNWAYEHWLSRWVDAGLLNAEQAAAVRDFEAAHDSLGHSQPTTDQLTTRPGTVELLAYVGALVALIGVVTLINAAGGSLTGYGSASLALAVGAFIAARQFLRAGSQPAQRAAGASAAFGAAALGIGIAELAAAAGIFVTRVTHPQSGYLGAYTTTDSAGVVLLGSVIVVSICLACMHRVPAGPLALVLSAAAFTAAGAVIGVAHLGAPQDGYLMGLILVAVGASVAGLGESLRGQQPSVQGLVGFIGTIGATIPLYFLGGDGHIALGVSGGAIAAAALYVGIAGSRSGLAYGGVVGLLGLVIDVGLRNFRTSSGLGLFLVVVGAGSLGALVGVNRAMRPRGR